MTKLPRHLEANHTLDADSLAYIHRASDVGVYDIRGLGAKRKVPHFHRVRHAVASTTINASSLSVFLGTRAPFANAATVRHVIEKRMAAPISVA